MALRRRIGVVLAIVGASAVAGCGGGDSGDQDGAADSPAAESLVEIHDRATDAGYDVPDDVLVGKNGDASLFIWLYGSGTPGNVVASGDAGDQSYGVYAPSLSILAVEASTDPERLRGTIKFESTTEKKALAQGKAAYVVIGDHLWWTAGKPSDPVIDEQAFLDLIGNLEECAPDCQVEESSFDR